MKSFKCKSLGKRFRRWPNTEHSRPLVIHYGNEKAVVFAGANDGMLHAFEDATGEEELSILTE